jgi:O-antigen/teichoic acid export membrane protein
VRSDRRPAKAARIAVAQDERAIRTAVEPGRPCLVSAALIRARCSVRDPASVLLLCQVSGAVAAFVANILAARALGPSGRGELALLLQIAYMSSLGLLLGTDRSVVAVYSGTHVRGVTRTFVRLLIAPSTICMAGAVALLAVPLPAFGTWRIGLAVALLFAVTNAFARAVRAIAIAARRQRDYLVYGLVSDGLLLLAIGLLYILGADDSTTWLLAYLIVNTVTAAVWFGAWSCRRPPRGATGPEGGLRESRREGLQLLPSALARSGVLRLDRLLLAGLASSAALGEYAAVATMTELIAWPVMAFVDSRLGVWREAHDRGELRLRRVLVLLSAYCAAASVLVGLATRFLLVPLLGAGYASASDLVLPLVGAAATYGVSQVLISVLIATRRNALASVLEVVGFGVSIVGYVVLVSRFGALGAAYGSLLGNLACMVPAAILLIHTWRRR